MRTCGAGVRSPATSSWTSHDRVGSIVSSSGKHGRGLERGGTAPDRVYLDYGGFAPVDPRVLAVIRPFLEAGIGNPSAPPSLGAQARQSLEAGRAQGAPLLGGAAPGTNLGPRGTA